MKNANDMPVMGIDRNKYRKLCRQYERENPHDLPELRRKRRPRIAVKRSLPTLVYSIHRPA